MMSGERISRKDGVAMALAAALFGAYLAVRAIHLPLIRMKPTHSGGTWPPVVSFRWIRISMLATTT